MSNLVLHLTNTDDIRINPSSFICEWCFHDIELRQIEPDLNLDQNVLLWRKPFDHITCPVCAQGYENFRINMDIPYLPLQFDLSPKCHGRIENRPWNCELEERTFLNYKSIQERARHRNEKGEIDG